MSDPNELRPVTVTARYQNSTFEDAVKIPAAQAAITALPIGILAGILTPALEIPANGFLVALIGFLLAFVVVWLWLRGYWSGLVEIVLTADLNRDGVIGPPAPELPRLPIALSTNNGQTVDYIDLPYLDRLPLLARGLAGGRPLTGSEWIGPGKFSRPEWENLISELTGRGLASWKNERAHQQGAILTAAGRAVFRKVAEIGEGLDAMNKSIVANQQTNATYASDSPPPPWDVWPMR